MVLEESLMTQFAHFLDENMGLSYPKERWKELEKRIGQISHSFGFDDPSLCVKWLLTNPITHQNLKVLALHLTIGETYFFRETSILENIQNTILPQLIERHQKERTLRIWSAGCCSGEESYTIAILLHRLIPNLDEWNVTLIGTDINPEFLEKAERGCYKPWSFRATPPEIKEQYFKENGDGTYTIIPSIRKMVKFTPLNLVTNPYPDITKGIYQMDLIFCHNVLIYFSNRQIKKTVHQFMETLTTGGWLSVTSIEVSFIQEEGLIPCKLKGATLFKKDPTVSLKQNHWVTVHEKKKEEAGRRTKVLQTTFPKKIPIKQPILEGARASKNREEIQDLFEISSKLYKEKKYDELIAMIRPLFEQIDHAILKEHLNEMQLLIKTYANQGNLKEALFLLEKAMSIEKLDPLLHHLHANLLQAQGNIPEAIRSLKRSLFLDSNSIIAYFNLAVLEKQGGNVKSAMRNFTTALELIDHLPPECEMVPETEDVTKKYLKDLIVHLKNS